MNTVNLLSTKIQLRRALKEKRSALTEAERMNGSRLAFNQLCKLSGNVLSFASFGKELNLWDLNRHFALKKQLILPKIEKKKLVLYRVDTIFDQLVPSSLGMLEPNLDKCKAISPEDIHYALVPGLGFDHAKHRIGYGKGYYDRLLPTLTHAVKIGIGFKQQFLEEGIPIEPSDYPLDELLLL